MGVSKIPAGAKGAILALQRDLSSSRFPRTPHLLQGLKDSHVWGFLEFLDFAIRTVESTLCQVKQSLHLMHDLYCIPQLPLSATAKQMVYQAVR